MTETGPKPVVLPYGNRQRMMWASRHRKLLVSLALLCCIVVPCARNWDAIDRYVRWQYWFRQCMSYQMRLDQPLIEINETAALIRLKEPDYVSWSKFAVFQPKCVQGLGSLDGRVFSGRTCAPMLFAGPVKRPDGKARLVVISGDIEQKNRVRASILPPPTLFESAQVRPVLSPIYSPVLPSEPIALTRVETDPAKSRIVLHLKASADESAQPSIQIEMTLEQDDTIRAAIHRGSDVEYVVWSPGGGAYNITYFQ